MLKAIVVGLIGVIGFSLPASAAEHTVYQKGKKFSERKMKISVGDTIVFVNDDKATHNVQSGSKTDSFDFGAQKPNTKVSHTFNNAGKVKVRCAIHPKMKITVIVE